MRLKKTINMTGLSKNIFRIGLIIVLALVVMYGINCVIHRKMTENFDNNSFCESAFTDPGTKVCLWSVYASKYLDLDISKVSNNIKLSPLSDDCSKWTMDRIITEESVNKPMSPFGCAVSLKLSKLVKTNISDEQKNKLSTLSGIDKSLQHLEDELEDLDLLHFYMTADPNSKSGEVSASPVGGASNNLWYVLRLKPDGGIGSKNQYLKSL